MQITIDTSERLDDVLRVVGAAYGVTLTSSRATVGGRAAHGAARAGAARSDTADIRAWARAHGHAVKDRGRIPAEVIAKYRSATRRRGRS